MNEYLDYLYDLITKNGISYEDIEYSHSLYSKLMSSDYMENGRSTTKDGIIEKLLETAENFDNDTIEGALASVFIYHQVAEEWMFDLLELIRFYIDLKLYPARMNHKPAEGLKLNALISEIENLIDFDHKDDLIKYGRIINQKRNDIAHALLKKSSIEEIKKGADEFHKHFNNLYNALEGDTDNFDGATEYFLEMIKQVHKWSDEFYDKYEFLLIENLEMNEINFIKETDFDK